MDWIDAYLISAIVMWLVFFFMVIQHSRYATNQAFGMTCSTAIMGAFWPLALTVLLVKVFKDSDELIYKIQTWRTEHQITNDTLYFWLYCLFGALCFAALIVIVACQVVDYYDETVSARVAKETAIMVAQVNDGQARIITSHAATHECNRVLSGELSMIEGFGEYPALFAQVKWVRMMPWKEGKL